MKFYVIEIATGDTKIAGCAIYEYASLNEAKAAYHGKIATAMKSDKYTSQMCKVINSVGGTYPELTNYYEVKEVVE